MNKPDRWAFIQHVRSTPAYGDETRSELLGLALLGVDWLEESLNELADLRECLVALQYLSDHPGYPGFIKYEDVKEILDDYVTKSSL